MGENISKKMIISVITLLFAFLLCGTVSAADNITNSTDLQVSLSVSKNTDTLQKNATNILVITASNNGPNDATNVKIKHDLPDGVEIVSYNARNGNYNPETREWTLDHLSPGGIPYGMSYLELIIKATAPGDHVFTTNITGAQNDTYLNNNNATLTINTPPYTDIQINQTVNNTSPLQNEQVTYTTTVTNNGPIDATQISVTDQLPTGLEFVSATGIYTYITSTKTITWTISNLANQTSTLLSLIAKITASSTTQINNIVKCSRINPPLVGGTQFDYNKTNNAACASVLVKKTADIQVTQP